MTRMTSSSLRTVCMMKHKVRPHTEETRIIQQRPLVGDKVGKTGGSREDVTVIWGLVCVHYCTEMGGRDGGMLRVQAALNF